MTRKIYTISSFTHFRIDLKSSFVIAIKSYLTAAFLAANLDAHPLTIYISFILMSISVSNVVLQIWSGFGNWNNSFRH